MASSRFTVISRRPKKIGETTFTVVQDVQTGVLYTYGQAFVGGGGITSHFTLLVDQNGKPVVKPIGYTED